MRKINISRYYQQEIFVFESFNYFKIFENKKTENTLCPICQGSGYKGRVGVYELLLLDRKIHNAISKGLTDSEIENVAVNKNSMLTFSQYGEELVKENLTTLSEVIRVCSSDY